MQQKINLTQVICLQIGNTIEAKPHSMNLRLLLPRIHYYQNIQLYVKESQYLIPTNSWTLTPILNWTCDVVTISPFQCTAPSTWLTNRCTDPSTWLTHQLKKDVGYKVFQFINTMKIKKLLGYKTLGVQKVAACSRERWTRANCLRSQFKWIITLHQVASP